MGGSTTLSEYKFLTAKDQKMLMDTHYNKSLVELSDYIAKYHAIDISWLHLIGKDYKEVLTIVDRAKVLQISENEDKRSVVFYLPDSPLSKISSEIRSCIICCHTSYTTLRTLVRLMRQQYSQLSQPVDYRVTELIKEEFNLIKAYIANLSATDLFIVLNKAKISPKILNKPNVISLITADLFRRKLCDIENHAINA